MWTVEMTPDAERDFNRLQGSVKQIVAKAIKKVARNPLPASEGGYGKPLGNKGGKNLTGLLKIKIVSIGIRVVYRLIRENGVMKILVVAARADGEVYSIAASRAAL